MEKSVRPVSEAYPSVCCSLNESGSCSSEAGLVKNDEGEQTPIFSLSKSSVDVKAGGPPHKRDPAWTRLDLRRSLSTNTQSDQNATPLKQLPPNLWHHDNSHQLSLTAQNVDVQSPPALSERWVPSMQRWSACSVGTQSRSSTPETVVWRGGSSRPPSLTQEISSTSTPDSPMSKLASPPATPSPLISPLDAISLPQEDLLSPSHPSTPNSAINQQEDIRESTAPNSPSRSPQQTPELRSNSPDVLQLNSTEDEGFLENNMLTFQFPSPIASSDRLTEAELSLDPKCLVDDVIEKLSSPRVTQSLDDEAARSSAKLFTYMLPNSPAGEEQEAGREPSASHLELPRPSEVSRPTGRGKRSPLVSSLSDSGLGHCCKCNQSTRDGLGRGDALREEATLTLQKEMVNTAVQTASPLGSWWDLRRNMSNSNMDSHSILGSPPGSRLNLKSSVGSNSNLVSPSSSMFPVSSGEEEEGGAKRGDDPAWDVVSASSHDLERRRSCLKMQVEEKDTLGRRSSMKQVQWDEDGMTWDVHGASVDPELLSTAIRKHLELHNSPKVPRRSSKKKRAPNPPNASDTVAAAATPPVVSDATEGDGKTEAEQEGRGKGEEAAEAPRRRSRAEADIVKDEEEVYGGGGGGGGVLVSKSQLHGSGHIRKRSLIRSLRRPGWCGGSKKTQD